MSELLEVVKAEYVFVYGDVIRRKSTLLSLLAYPYMLTTESLAF